MSIVLPIEKPIITFIPRHANKLSIVQTHSCFDDWLMNNYIFISINYDYTKINVEDYLNIYSSEIIDEFMLTRDIICHGMDILSSIIVLLHEKYYITIMIDRFYLSAYNAKRHVNHPIFIYGYDDNAKMFYIADFFASGYYGTTRCSYAELSLAIDRVLETKDESALYKYSKTLFYKEIELINIYRVNYSARSCYGEEALKRNLLAYCDREFPNYPIQRNDVYGLTTNKFSCNLNFYKILRNYITYNFETFGFVFHRPFYLIVSHKKLMLYRLQQIEKAQRENEWEHTRSCLTNIVSKSELALNRVLKANISKNKKLLSKIYDDLNFIEQLDEEAMALFVNLLDKKSSNRPLK